MKDRWTRWFVRKLWVCNLLIRKRKGCQSIKDKISYHDLLWWWLSKHHSRDLQEAASSMKFDEFSIKSLTPDTEHNGGEASGSHRRCHLKWHIISCAAEEVCCQSSTM